LRQYKKQFPILGTTELRWYEDITACDARPSGRAWTLTVQVQEQSDDFVVSEAFAAKFLQLFAQRKQEETSPVDKYRLAMEALAVEAIKHAGAVGDPEAQLFYKGLGNGLVEFRNYPKPTASLDGSFVMDRGRKQGWARMATVKRHFQTGIEPPATSLPEFLDQDRLFAPGWIEVLGTTTSWEGVFDSHDAFIFRETKGPDLGPRGRIAWSQVNWVRLAPLPSLSPGVRDARSPILARSIDGNVLYGSLTGPKGSGTEMFGLVGTAMRSGAEWLDVFQTAGVKLRA
jgi:hypothetical protein